MCARVRVEWGSGGAFVVAVVAVRWSGGAVGGFVSRDVLLRHLAVPCLWCHNQHSYLFGKRSMPAHPRHMHARERTRVVPPAPGGLPIAHLHPAPSRPPTHPPTSLRAALRR